MVPANFVLMPTHFLFITFYHLLTLNNERKFRISRVIVVPRVDCISVNNFFLNYFRLYIPLYSSKAILKSKLLMAIKTKNFGFVWNEKKHLVNAIFFCYENNQFYFVLSICSKFKMRSKNKKKENANLSSELPFSKKLCFFSRIDVYKHFTSSFCSKFKMFPNLLDK